MKRVDFETGLSVAFDFISASSDKKLLIIAGGSCSGKSYFVLKLAKMLLASKIENSIAPLDCYFRNGDDPLLPKNALEKNIFDAPDSYHRDEYVSDVINLLFGKDLWLPNYDIESNSRIASNTKIVSTNNVIGDGLHAITFLNKAYHNSMKLYIEADEETRIKRRVDRIVARCDASPDLIIKYFKERVIPCHNEFVVPQAEMADVVVEN